MSDVPEHLRRFLNEPHTDHADGDPTPTHGVARPISPCPLCGEVFIRTDDDATAWRCPCGHWAGVRFHERGALDLDQPKENQ